MSSQIDPPPFNPLPPVVVALVLAIFGVEVVLWLGAKGVLGGPEAVGWRLDLLNRYSVPGNLLAAMRETGQVTPDYLLRYLTYTFIHRGFAHMLFVGVLTLALGKFVGEVFRGWALLVVFFGASVAGAVVYGLIAPRPALVGGYPAVFGLVGAFTYILWTRLGAVGENRGRSFILIGVLLLVRVVFAAVQTMFEGAESVGFYWVAELAGFAAGFGLSFIVSPGGWRHLLAQMRRR